jgi:hypothetical protein
MLILLLLLLIDELLELHNMLEYLMQMIDIMFDLIEQTLLYEEERLELMFNK